MRDPKASEALGTLSLIERQMLLYNARRRLVRENPAVELPGPYRFITISRDIGALGDFVASELATRLCWHIFEKEIVDYIAKHGHVRQDLVRQMDERGQSLVHDTVDRLLRMFQGGSFGNEEYHAALLKTLATLAAQGGAILVGHGGAFALQGQPGLHVRITASQTARIERLSQRWMASIEETRKRVQQIDEERRQFILYHFKVNREDSRFFDLIFSTDHIGVEQVVQSILGAMQHPEKVVLTPARPPVPERATASASENPGSSEPRS
jgi:cytidylate kinase